MSNYDLHDRKLKLTDKRILDLNRLGIYDSDSLISYYPYRYDELNAVPFEQWKIKDKITLEARVTGTVRSFRFGRGKTVSHFDVQTDDRFFHVTIYNRPWVRNLKEDQTLTLSGIYMGKDKITAMNYSEKPMSEMDAVTPVYSVVKGIQQRTIRECIRHALNVNDGSDLIPGSLMDHYHLMHRIDALRMIHEPKSMEEVRQSWRTLKYEEFLKFFLSVQMIRNQQSSQCGRKTRAFEQKDMDRMIASLPYELTQGQTDAVRDILHDMRSDKAMYRLVQGDVGCGKTAVAAAALYAETLAGYQTALLAPTEILARQHFETMKKIFRFLPVRIEVLYAGEETEKKNQILKDLREGRTDLLIGTHSLLQDTVVFQNLGLVIADEQQRFGVEQRRTLKEKGTQVDFLLMSATPIPRTLASTLYGDMDISTIETMPAGRKPVVTVQLNENSFRSVLKDVEALLEEGHQLYVICAAVEDSENYDARNVKDVYQSLKKLFAGKYQVGLLYGKMNSVQKQEVMEEFAKNEIQILVSTTVVEVGMNVVNATGMIIYDADRFGLSQLHQLRGRVQRGSETGRFWLLSDSQDEKVRQRLDVLCKVSSGFEISYEDLRLRGPGDILGTKQSGVPDFVLANIVQDSNMIAPARKDAENILNHRTLPENQAILREVLQINRKNAAFID